MSIGMLLFNPCANLSGQGDSLGVMQRNVKNLSKAYLLNEQGCESVRTLAGKL